MTIILSATPGPEPTQLPAKLPQAIPFTGSWAILRVEAHDGNSQYDAGMTASYNVTIDPVVNKN